MDALAFNYTAPQNSAPSHRNQPSAVAEAADAPPNHDQGSVGIEAPPPPEGRTPKASGSFAPAAKRIATIVVAAIAILVSLLTWQSYVLSPWTRNGAVRAQVAGIAPQVSGQIIDIRVSDNQFVRKGDVLYAIDPFDFEVALRSNKALLDQRAADLELKQAQMERRLKLSNLATTPEEQQIYASMAAQAKAAFEAAKQQVAQSELNLRRTKVLSPVNGYVTNLLLRVGDYAPAGARNISIIDSDSFWVDGYFEETKLGQLCVGDPAEVKLLGYAEPITGHAETITRGISVANAAAGVQGLPSVDPIYTWVRLAQRVPVRIAIDKVPSGVPLVSGMTATITMRPASVTKPGDKGSGAHTRLINLVSEVFNGSPSSRLGCIPAMPETNRPTESLAVPTVQPASSPQQLEPGIAPGLNETPRVK